MIWQLRRANRDDVGSIMALETRIFAKDAWSVEAMARDVTDPNCYYLVAFPPDVPTQIDAYAGLLSPRRALQGDIQTIAVTEDARGHGLGRTLMLALLTEARKRGAREVFLEVRADNPDAQRVYRRLGFEDLGVRRGYYQPDDVDALVMRVRLPDPVSAPALLNEPAAAPDEPAHPRPEATQ
jgi:ribosomal-protein-alanine acetyltransferase